MKYILALIIAVSSIGCGTYNSPYISPSDDKKFSENLPKGEIKHRLYMIGDAGGFNDIELGQNYVLNAVNRRMNADKAEKSIVFLGDNIYNKGLGAVNDPDRAREQSIIQAHLDVAEGNDANMYIIPGNHDWNNNKAGGLAAINRQEEYIKNNRIAKDRIKFYPKNGCGDPKVVKIDKDIVYVIFDSQWWVHDWSTEEKINKGCKIKSRREFLDRMKDIIIEHKNDQIVFFMHHPIVSNGNHGGKFSLKEHIFPLTRMNKYAYLPLPILGSIYPIRRQLGGSNQDVSYKLLHELHSHLEGVIRGFDAARTVFVSGHDHFLQYNEEQFIFQKSPIHYIVSGSGYKEAYAARGHDASFVYSKRGYSVLNFYKNGSTWLDFYTVDEKDQSEKLVYRKQIFDGRPGLEDNYRQGQENTVLADSITIAPNATFGKKGTYRFFLGDQFRTSWTTPVATSIIDLDTKYGGLRPVKKGGGLFSKTLRLEKADEKQFVLRSVNKDFFKAVPEKWKGLQLLKLYADQNTASIPYGALYVAALSEYAGIYHTAPELVYFKDQKALGAFKPYFPEGHYILEARPDGNWEGDELFGGSKKIIGFNDLLYKLRKKTNHFVDQKWVLKSRLFDIFIHDRDRHDDQWRWAGFKEDGKTVYRPVPRDRDWAFFKYGGVVPWVMGNVVDKKLKSFTKNSIDVKSLATNANNFDRYFLNELTWDDWDTVIDEFVADMTDEAIENSIEALPIESRPYLTDEIVEKLKGRREILKRDVKKYYDYMTQEVEIIGGDEKDIFEITMLADGSTRVRVHKDSKNHGKVLKYDRTMPANETTEIRIYGLAGKDKFNVNMIGSGHAKIRIIGGTGKDKLSIVSSNESSEKIAIYDEPDGMVVDDMSLVRDHRDTDLKTNEYNRLGFLYDTGLPWLNLGYDADDGLIVGIGFNTIKHKWRKSPYSSSHLFNFEATPTSSRFGMDIEYEGEYVDAFGKGVGFAPSAFLEIPDYKNFFGLGANSKNDNPERSYYWVKMSDYGVSPMVVLRNYQHRIRFKFGPTYRSTRIVIDDDDGDQNILMDSDDVVESDFARSHFLGLEAELKLHTLDRVNKPSRGFLVRARAKHQYEWTRKNHTLKLEGNVSFFIPLSVPYDIVLGSSIGYQKIIGDPLFYQYPSMGNKHFLRAFRGNRFRGESIAFQQWDLRFKLFNWNNTVVPMTIGGIAGYDYGKVYYKGEDTGPIKHGWSTGVWFDLLGYFILRTTYSGSEEGNYFVFDVGFNF